MPGISQRAAARGRPAVRARAMPHDSFWTPCHRTSSPAKSCSSQCAAVIRQFFIGFFAPSLVNSQQRTDTQTLFGLLETEKTLRVFVGFGIRSFVFRCVCFRVCLGEFFGFGVYTPCYYYCCDGYFRRLAGVSFVCVLLCSTVSVKHNSNRQKQLLLFYSYRGGITTGK